MHNIAMFYTDATLQVCIVQYAAVPPYVHGLSGYFMPLFLGHV